MAFSTGTLITDGGLSGTVSTSGTQTISGDKTFTGAVNVTDSLFSIRDNLDLTKIAQFQVSSITSGATRTFTFPDTTGTLVLTNQTTTTLGSTTAAATLNIGAGVTATGNTKTANLATAGASGSTTNINIGSATAGALGTTTINSPTVAFGATVTAINLPDVATFLQDNADATKQLQFQLSGITTATTRTVTAANGSGVMVLDTFAQTLTNKTIDLASNTLTGTLAQFNTAVSDADIAPIASPTFTGTLTTPTARFNGASASGYIAGGGGAVTQITSRTTGVTLNSPSGQITMFNAAGSATWDEFEVTCSAMAIADTVILTQRGGTNNYIFRSRAKAGSFMVGFATTGGTASDAPLINYAIIKASTT